MRADTALTSTSGFNGELEDSIFCIIEETDVRGDNKNTRSNHSYNRLKDWVTSNQINIHRKGATPYMVPNYTHWVQCANEQSYIPVFQGDTRVTVLYVDTLPNDVKVPKRELWAALTKEAPDFLSALLNMDIPDSRDRLMLPVIRSAEKEAAEFNNMGPVDQFLKECTFQISGNVISAEDLYNEFLKWIGMEEGMHWNKNKFGRAMPHSIPRGRVGSSQQRHYGNISLNKDALPTDKLFQSGLFLVKEKK
jgi:phage/plasmid-associated DNA primase